MINTMTEIPPVATAEAIFPFSDSDHFQHGSNLYSQLISSNGAAGLALSQYVDQAREQMRAYRSDKNSNPDDIQALKENASGFAQQAILAGDLNNALLALEAADELNNAKVRVALLRLAQDKGVILNDLYKQLGLEDRNGHGVPWLDDLPNRKK